MTPTPNLTMTADQAEQRVKGFIHGMNRGRQMPKIPPSIKRMAEEDTVHVFNVGPWDHQVPMGSTGTFFIPKCEIGQSHSAMNPLPGIIFEYYPENEKKMAYFEEDGRYVAEQILGIGPHRPPSMSLTKYGCFVAAGKEPNEAELEKARGVLHMYYQELIQEARTAWEMGPKEAEIIIKPELHFLAARALNLTDEPWLLQRTAAKRQTCEGCGSSVSATIIVCPVCRFVLDVERYNEKRTRFAK